MRRFIFAERNGIYIIDLQKTLNQLKLAQELVRDVVSKGDNVLFVCTKKQLKAIIQAEANKCGAFYVTERWLGGTLTNFATIKKQTRRLKELEQGQEEGSFEFFTKKEQLLFERERVKLDRNLAGIKNMTRLPARCSWSTPRRSASRSPKPTSSASRSWRSSTRTPIPT
jgi:small subunit ribosomal protein S2